MALCHPLQLLGLVCACWRAEQAGKTSFGTLGRGHGANEATAGAVRSEAEPTEHCAQEDRDDGHGGITKDQALNP